MCCRGKQSPHWRGWVADRDIASRLGALTQARIGLARTGQSLGTSAALDFELAHARARDAVHASFDTTSLHTAFGCCGVIEVHSQAMDRGTYLQRPDLGRRLAPDDRAKMLPTGADLAIIIADGLSATAVAHHAVPLLTALLPHLTLFRIAPIIAAHQARVALGDDIGEAVGAKLCLMLIGERPGLSAADSLGAYITWGPRCGRRDSERNCVSNIRPPHGLGYTAAANRIAWLLGEAKSRQLTGVDLKDESGSARIGPLSSPLQS